MTDRPILFSAPMVRALLDGRKTQTRRVAKFVIEDAPGVFRAHSGGGGMAGLAEQDVPQWAPNYAPYAIGDRLWVKEAWTVGGVYTDCIEARYRAHERASHTEFVEQIPISRAGKLPQARWPKCASPIHMPRWASRITLTVTDVRVQRLQAISDDDALAEGVAAVGGRYLDDCSERWHSSTVAEFRALWNSINGPTAWDENPWVVAVTFTVARRNIDEVSP